MPALDVVALGYNYRIDEIRAAIGIEQLKKLPAGNARREVLTRRYQERFRKLCPDLGLPFMEKRGQSSFHIFPVLLPEDVDKDAFRESLKEQGIQSSFHYPPVHHFENYRQFAPNSENDLAVTEQAAKREVTLPLFPTMTEEQQDWVIEATVKALQQCRRL